MIKIKWLLGITVCIKSDEIEMFYQLLYTLVLRTLSLSQLDVLYLRYSRLLHNRCMISFNSGFWVLRAVFP